MSISAFTVLTEFRFDVASAVVGTDTLKNKVEGLSAAADNAVHSVKGLGASFVTHMGLGAGGIVGFLINAIKSSEKFAQSQRNLSNILLANRDHLKMGGLGFHKALELSSQVMDQILTKAQRFGLDPNELLDQSKMIAPMLINKGMDDQTMTRSVDIARGLLKSAPTLGLDPSNLQGQLIRLVEGNADMNNTLFLRLMSEAGDVFKEHGIAGSKTYNALGKKDPVAMIKALDAALYKFGNNAEILDANMRSVTGQLRIMGAMLHGQFSIFKGIGEAFSKPIRELLMNVNLWLKTEGKALADHFAKVFGVMLRDPERQLTRLMALRDLGKNLASVTTFFHNVGKIHMIASLGEMAAQSPRMRKMMGPKASSNLGAASNIGLWLADFVLSSFTPFKNALLKGGRAGFLGVLRYLPVLIGEIVVIFGTLMFMLQSLATGFAQGRLNSIKWLAQNGSRFTEAMSKFGSAMMKILYPLKLAQEAFIFIGRLITDLSLLGEVIIWFANALGPVADSVGNVILGLIVLIGGLSRVFVGLLHTAYALMTPGGLVTTEGRANAMQGLKIGENFLAGMNAVGADFRNARREGQLPGEEDRKTGKTNININTLQMNNSFKEQMEPDRIALSIKEQFVKAALNPTSARRGGTAALVGG